MRAFAVEMRKLARRATLATAVAWLLALTAVVAFYLANADTQYGIAVSAYEEVAHPPSPPELCRRLAQPVGPACDAAREEELRSARAFLAETSTLYPIAEAALDPVGVGGVVAGLASSTLGFLVVGGLAAAHVAGEWSAGTVKVLLARDPRRLRLVALKVASTWLAGVGLMLAGWACLALLSPMLRRTYQVPPGAPDVAGWGYPAEQMGRAVLVLGAVAAIGVAAGIVVRAPLGAFGVQVAALFAAVVSAAWHSTYRYGPGYFVAAWMGFRPETSWGDHLWVDRFPLVDPRPDMPLDAAYGAAGLVAVIVLALGVAAVRMVRSDVGG